jgi:predicted RND superfamily exporter protein/lauroyl/myristoyl acyltransferase
MSSRGLRWGWLLLIVPAIIGFARLRFDVEVLNLLPDELPVVEGLKLYQKHFASENELIVTVQSGDAEATEAAARQLALALRAQTNLVARALWQPPWREHPEQMAELVALTWLNQPPETFARLANRLSPDNLPVELAAAGEALATSLSPDELARLGYDPLGLSLLPESVVAQTGDHVQGEELFASRAGTFRLIFLKPATPLGSYRACAAWLESVRTSVEKIRHAEKIPATAQVGYTGAPAFIAETAGGMERDISGSATGTLLVVGILFWWAHRRLWPLCWLTVLLLLVLAGTLALGGLIYGGLNVVSLGFAAILIGLTDDYPAILYQEALDHPQLSATDIRRRCTPPIVWSAVTTAGAFMLLNFAALPGLGQLGTLVGLGVLLAAVVILYGYLPIALKRRSRNGNAHQASIPTSAGVPKSRPGGKLALPIAFALPIVILALLWHRPPAIDHTAEALSPTDSPAYVTMKAIASHLAGNGDPLWILVSGRDETEVARKMDALAARAPLPEVRQWLGKVTFPIALWPRPEWQQTNLVSAAKLFKQSASLRAAVLAAGFNDEGFAFAKTVLETWERAGKATGAVWPTNETSRWLLEKVAARTDNGWLALGIAQPNTNSTVAYAGAVAALGETLADNGARLTGWSALGEALLVHTARRLPWLAAAMILLIAFCLWLAFRNVREVLLSFATLGAGFLGLLALMSLFGWSWNLMNLVAVPLLLGASVDYTIHTQLALRRNGGNIIGFRRTTGRALLLGGATTIVGFASLAWAGNAGLASLGLVCSVGIACGLLASIGLLPVWWVWLSPASEVQSQSSEKPSPILPGATLPVYEVHATPSSSYRAEVWLLGLFAVRVLPDRLCEGISVVAGSVYRWLRPHRFRVVVENLLPVFGGDTVKAEKTARALFREFALKIAHLWRFEGGEAIDHWPAEWAGGEFFTSAQARGRGVLLVTPHLGNWEFGGAFLTERGVKLLVLTLPEPGRGFTELRQQSRARRGIETLVVGEDAFAFVEIIKRLQAGATVALLVDRPPPPTAVTVELFGRPFQASVAAAELARASGCAIIPAIIVRNPRGYLAEILPEIVYDRAAIGDRAARIRLTQEILRAFEPAIREHAAQWYHFVPVWPK